ncbi:hypothetical protein TWF694_004752 [Orbilia ellipsospora]|uniref:PA14 domain-containing protein n=1 Tax=Orbilia ellipsospora TaxID=2528407 RepID=A0AAV9WW79_9PEZI
MRFFLGLLQLSLLVSVAFGSSCKTDAKCNDISEELSSYCSACIQDGNIQLPTCTSTVTKPTTTTTKSVKKGKATSTSWRTSTTTKTVHTDCYTSIKSKFVTKVVHKTVCSTKTKTSTICNTRTLCTTKTVTKVVTKRITGNPPINTAPSYLELLRRGNALPASCSCFATKTQVSTTTPHKTKTVTIPSSTVRVYKTKRVTKTRTIGDITSTRTSTCYTTYTSTHRSTSTKCVTKSITAYVRSTTTKTITSTKTVYIGLTTITSLATGDIDEKITLYPTDSNGNKITNLANGVLTVINAVTLPEASVTIAGIGFSDYFSTVWPTDSNGNPLTDGSGTKTVVRYVSQPTTALTLPATEGVNGPSTKTLYPTDAFGRTISDGSEPFTIINILPVTTVSSGIIGTGATSVVTIFPTASGQIFTVIHYIRTSTSTTIAMGTATTEYFSTITPDVPGPITLIDYLPVVVINSPYLAPVASTVTIFPSSDAIGTNRAFTVIHYITRPRTTKTNIALGPTGYTSIVTQGTGPVTVINLVPAVTIQASYTGTGPSTSTITPTASGQFFTIVHYDLKAFTSVIRHTIPPRSTVTVTQGGTSTKGYSSTLPIASGTGPITVVTFLPEVILANTYGIGGPSTVTILPTGNEKAIRVIEYTVAPAKTVIVTRTPPPHGSTVIIIHTPPPHGSTVIVIHTPTATTTVTSVGSSVYNTTISPTVAGDPITVIDYTTRSATVLTSVGTSAFNTTQFPPTTAPPNVPITIIKVVTRSVTTLTSVGNSVFNTTELPPSTASPDVPITVVQVTTRSITTITSVGNSVFDTTELPPSTASPDVPITVIHATTRSVTTLHSIGSAAFNSTEYPPSTAPPDVPITVIDVTTRSAITLTSLGSSAFVSTVFPPSSAPASVPITIVDYTTLPRATITKTDRSAHITTESPTDSTNISETVSIITYAAQPTTTITRVGAIVHTAISYPTDSAGSTLTDSGTITQIDYVVLPTVTLTSMGASNYISTIAPTDPADISGTVTVIDYYSLATQTVTIAGVSDFETTIYPTDSAGATVLTATATVISYYQPTYTDTPPVPCSKNGYIIGNSSFFSINLLSGVLTTLKANENAGAGFNSLGYNILDGFIYGQGVINGIGRVLRVHGNGVYSLVPITPAQNNLVTNCGEIDANGQYWVGASGTSWLQINLNPNNGTYGRVVGSGTMTTITGLGAADWVYIPGAGPYLWTFASNTTSSGLIKWSTVTKKWTLDYLFPYPNPILGTGGAFGDSNGDLFFIVNGQGTIYKTNVFTKITPVLIGVTNVFGGLDAARCVYGNTVSDLAGDGDAVCTHEGLEVAIFDHPWGQSLPSFQNDPNWLAFNPTYFRTETPYDQTITRSVGFNTAAFWNQPYGMMPENFTDTTDNLQYALMYRGYFFAPIAATYTFTVSLGNNWVGVWLGALANGNWTRTNINLGALQAKNGTTPTVLTNKFTVKLNKGQYYPMRVLLGNAGGSAGFGFSIADSDGTFYARTAQESPYFVRYGCSGTPVGFTRAFGNETVT